MPLNTGWTTGGPSSSCEMIILRNNSFAVGDFLANAVEVGFLPPWFYKIYETQKFKTFFDNFDTMYDYAELFIGRRINELEEKSCKPSKETERDQAGFFKFLLASGKLTKDDLLANVIDVLFAGVDKNPEKRRFFDEKCSQWWEILPLQRRKRSLVYHI